MRFKVIIFSLAVIFILLIVSYTVDARLRRVNKLLIIYNNGKQCIAYTLDRPKAYVTSHGGSAVIKRAGILKSWLIEDHGSIYGKNLKTTEPNAKANSPPKEPLAQNTLKAPHHKNSRPKSSKSINRLQLTKNAPKPKNTSKIVASKTPGNLSSTILKRIARYDKFINRYAKKYKLDPNLLKAVIYVESSGNPSAVSHKGAKGLMQLMDDTAREMNVQNVFNPTQNLEGGAKYLRQQLDAFQNNLPLALAAYNSGANNVKRGITFQETRRYVKRILAVKKALSSSE